MTNTEVVDAFVDILLKAPDHTMEALCLRLSASKYEMVLKRVDPLNHFYMETAQRYNYPGSHQGNHQEEIRHMLEKK